MPKLNTTINNLELKSNKIISSTSGSSFDWTDDQYPSAKVLHNSKREAHPIGSILVTSTNVNPAEDLEGSWILVDKAFASTFVSGFWRSHNSTLNSDSGAVVADHLIHFRLNIKSNMALGTAVASSGVSLGQILLSEFGLSALPHTIYGSTISNTGEFTVSYKISTDGTILARDAVKTDGTHNMPVSSNNNFYIELAVPLVYTAMIDELCDKFYWKRTA